MYGEYALGYNFITFYNHNHQQYGSRIYIWLKKNDLTSWRRDITTEWWFIPNGSFSQIFYGAEKQDMNGDDSLSEETYFQVSDGIQSRDFIGTLHSVYRAELWSLRPCFSQWCGFWTRDSIGTWYFLWGSWRVDNKKACQFSCEFGRLANLWGWTHCPYIYSKTEILLGYIANLLWYFDVLEKGEVSRNKPWEPVQYRCWGHWWEIHWIWRKLRPGVFFHGTSTGVKIQGRICPENGVIEGLAPSTRVPDDVRCIL